jgi:hypothetical protein
MTGVRECVGMHDRDVGDAGGDGWRVETVGAWQAGVIEPQLKPSKAKPHDHDRVIAKPRRKGRTR